MTNDQFFLKLVEKMDEVTIVPPQTVGPFTGFYKSLTSQFKVAPWKSAGIVSFLATLSMYLLVGGLLIRLASILQYGY
jgi:hypothetical protein